MRGPLLALALVGCGYRALYATDAGERLGVSLVRVAVPSGAVGQEVLTGAREELAKVGALAPGEGYPRLEIEVTGVSETGPVTSNGPPSWSIGRRTSGPSMERACATTS